MKLKLYYRFEKEADFAKDEYGNSVPTYTCFSMDCKIDNLDEAIYNKYAERIKVALIKDVFNLDEKLITVISREEYLKYNDPPEDF